VTHTTDGFVQRKLLSPEKKGINEIVWEWLVSARWRKIPISKGRCEKAWKYEIALKLWTVSAKFQNQTQRCILVFLPTTRQYEYRNCWFRGILIISYQCETQDNCDETGSHMLPAKLCVLNPFFTETPFFSLICKQFHLLRVCMKLLFHSLSQ
jgi:hypothetical protein